MADTTSALSFADGQRRGRKQRSITAVLSRVQPGGWTWRAGLAGMVAGHMTAGHLQPAAADVQLPVGGSLSCGVSRALALDDHQRWVFTGGATATTSVAKESGGPNDDGALAVALDLRLIGTVAYVATSWLTPYVSGRLFGGPVLWRERQQAPWTGGTDRYHANVAAGVVITTPTGVFVSTEYGPGGERSWSVEMGALY